MWVVPNHICRFSRHPGPMRRSLARRRHTGNHSERWAGMLRPGPSAGGLPPAPASKEQGLRGARPLGTGGDGGPRRALPARRRPTRHLHVATSHAGSHAHAPDLDCYHPGSR